LSEVFVFYLYVFFQESNNSRRVVITLSERLLLLMECSRFFKLTSQRRPPIVLRYVAIPGVTTEQPNVIAGILPRYRRWRNICDELYAHNLHTLRDFGKVLSWSL